jgi:hypothetical protein
MENLKQDFWQEKISAWEKSGLSQPKFCSQEGVPLTTFRYWKNRLAKGGTHPQFVKIQPPDASAGQICIDFDSRLKIIIDRPFSGSIVSKIIVAVDEAICASTGKR